jgi:hypothetical protein
VVDQGEGPTTEEREKRGDLRVYGSYASEVVEVASLELPFA